MQSYKSISYLVRNVHKIALIKKFERIKMIYQKHNAINKYVLNILLIVAKNLPYCKKKNFTFID